jgi:bifunctional NMN adenylyltransferase/nudix hydrolase
MHTNVNIGTPAPASFNPYHMAVFIGRFQPFHDGHLSVITEALAASDTLLVLVGSCDRPRDTFNPFTFEERRQMILESLPKDERPRVLLLPIVDLTYSDEHWIVQVQEQAVAARKHFGLDHSARIALVGHSKDQSSFYLKMFPQWSSMQVANYRGISATPIRKRYFMNGAEIASGEVPASTADFMSGFRDSEAYIATREEFEFVERYRMPYKALPYPPVFVTVDAVVVQSGHILLVERRARPGKGLMALPGGFIGADEKIEDAVVRELREETRLKVPDPVLRGSLIESRVFDDPHRSARGRTITHAFYFRLNDAVDLPKVKGGDDAKSAQWYPIGELQRDLFFEDHYSIITKIIGTH